MTNWLSTEEQRAWRAYRRTVLLVDSAIVRDLSSASKLSMPDYQVLSSLSEVDDHKWRLSALAASMEWSPSRLSHHVTRMEQRGLVTRAECHDDGRGSWVVLTERGLNAIRDAAPGHVASVRKHLIDLLSPAQVRSLSEIGETVIAGSGEPVSYEAGVLRERASGDQSAKQRPVRRS